MSLNRYGFVVLYQKNTNIDLLCHTVVNIPLDLPVLKLNIKVKKV